MKNCLKMLFQGLVWQTRKAGHAPLQGMRGSVVRRLEEEGIDVINCHAAWLGHTKI